MVNSWWACFQALALMMMMTLTLMLLTPTMMMMKPKMMMMMMKTRVVCGEHLAGLPPVTGSNEDVNVAGDDDDDDDDDDEADDDADDDDADDDEDVNLSLHKFASHQAASCYLASYNLNCWIFVTFGFLVYLFLTFS